MSASNGLSTAVQRRQFIDVEQNHPLHQALVAQPASGGVKDVWVKGATFARNHWKALSIAALAAGNVTLGVLYAHKSNELSKATNGGHDAGALTECPVYEAGLLNLAPQISQSAIASLSDYAAEPTMPGIPDEPNDTLGVWVEFDAPPAGATLFGRKGVPSADEVVSSNVLNDGYLAATVAALVKKNPNFLQNSFRHDGVAADGRNLYSVRFFVPNPKTGQRQETWVKVDDSLPYVFQLGVDEPFLLGAATSDGVYTADEGPSLWFPLLEKAFTKLNNAYNLLPYQPADQGYMSTGQGGLHEAFKALTGLSAETFVPASVFASMNAGYSYNNDLIADSLDLTLSRLATPNVAGFATLRAFQTMSTTQDAYGNTQWAPGFCQATQSVNYADGTSIGDFQGQGLTLSRPNEPTLILLAGSPMSIMGVDRAAGTIALRSTFGYNAGEEDGMPIVPTFSADGSVNITAQNSLPPTLNLRTDDFKRLVDQVSWGLTPA